MEESLVLTNIIRHVDTVVVLVGLVTLIYYRKYIFPGIVLNVSHWVRILVEDVGLLVSSLFWLSLCAVPHGLCILWKCVLYTYVKLKHGQLGDTLDSLDVIGVVENDDSPVIITSLKVLRGDCNLEKLRARIEATVGKREASGRLVFPKFYQTLEDLTGHAVWRPAAQFDINHHVRFLDGLHASSESLSEAEAFRMISNVSKAKFRAGHSPWEILVIPKFHYDHETPSVGIVGGSQAEPKLAILIRIHHGIGDGYSLLKLIIRDTSLPSDPPVTCPVPGSGRAPGMPLWKQCLVLIYLAIRSPRALWVELVSSDENPLFGRAHSGKTVLVWSRPISIHFLKEVKQRTGVGLSTTFLTALMSSVRKYIVEEYKEDPTSLSAVIPFPAPNHPDNKMTNKFSFVRFPLPCAEADPPASLKLVDQESRKLGTAPDGPLNLFLLRLLGVYPTWFIRAFLRNRQSTLVVSNLPGPSENISIWGKPLAETMFWIPPLGNSGISASFLSYNSKFRLGLTVDTGVVADGQAGAMRLVDGFVEAIIAMANSVKIPLDDAFPNQMPSQVPTSLSLPPSSESEDGDSESEAETSGHYSFTSSEVDCVSDEDDECRECRRDFGQDREKVLKNGRSGVPLRRRSRSISPTAIIVGNRPKPLISKTEHFPTARVRCNSARYPTQARKF